MDRSKELRRAALIAIVLSGSLLAACSQPAPPPAPPPAPAAAPAPPPPAPAVRG